LYGPKLGKHLHQTDHVDYLLYGSTTIDTTLP
jgi:hypothetical protein